MNFLQRFFSGRYGSYGVDPLGWALFVGYLVVYLLSLLTRWWVLEVLNLAVLAFLFYRMFSRNIPKRQAENQRFLQLTAPVRSWWRTRSMKRTDKEHKYFKCPNCGQQLRVPRGNGKIKVTCRACGASFEEKS